MDLLTLPYVFKSKGKQVYYDVNENNMQLHALDE